MMSSTTFEALKWSSMRLRDQTAAHSHDNHGMIESVGSTVQGHKLSSVQEKVYGQKPIFEGSISPEIVTNTLQAILKKREQQDEG